MELFEPHAHRSFLLFMKVSLVIKIIIHLNQSQRPSFQNFFCFMAWKMCQDTSSVV
jgi:hypothetical protein